MYAFWQIYVEKKAKKALKINDVALFVTYLDQKWVHYILRYYKLVYCWIAGRCYRI